MTLKIAILATCLQDEPFYIGFPSEAEQISAMLKNQRPNWRFSVYRIQNDHFPDLSEYDGFVVSGSPASVNDDEVWIHDLLQYIRDIFASGKPMAGICFGHQAIAKALGGEVVQSPSGWSLGSVEIELSKQFEWLPSETGFLNLFGIHSEQVLTAPKDAEVLAKTSHCPIAAYRIGSQVFTTQHHPEMPGNFVKHIIEHLAPDLESGMINKARTSMENEVHSDSLANWMASFLEFGKIEQFAEQ